MKGTRLILISLAVLVCFGAVGVATKQSAQKHETTEDATVVQKGVFTAKQREHSKLFEGYSLDSIPLVDKSKDDFTLTLGSEAQPHPADMQPDLTAFVKGKVCESDAIIMGRVTKKESQLTVRGDFIFTDYTVKWDKVLKDDTNTSIKPFENVVVTGAGGAVRINGQTITVTQQGKERLHVGDSYLLFLRRVPSTGAYTVLGGSSAISQINGEIKGLTRQQFGEFQAGTNIAPVVDLIQTNVVKSCEGTR